MWRRRSPPDHLVQCEGGRFPQQKIVGGRLPPSPRLLRPCQEHKNRIIPGLNEFCQELYSVTRTKFFEWDNAGQIRSGALFDEIKMARTSFQDALNFCRWNEKNMRRDTIFAKFASVNKMNFWKEIRD